jgi:methyl halide transferase
VTASPKWTAARVSPAHEWSRSGTLIETPIMPAIDWDEHYKSGNPPWETGQPSAELRRVVAEERIQPGAAIDLGCGSGINSIWLAQQGYDVTGVDFNALAIDKARERAVLAGARVKFEQVDVLNFPDGFGPFPFFFDRGCYHAVRRDDVGAYLRTLEKITAPGSVGLVLTGNAKEPSPEGQGPPVVSEKEIRAELGSLFEITRLREFRFDVNEQLGTAPLAWSCLLKRGKSGA